jgi:hypothetical protein
MEGECEGERSESTLSGRFYSFLGAKNGQTATCR